MLTEGTSRPHLLCMFNPGIGWQCAVDRCVGLIFAMSLWNMSVRLECDAMMADYAGQVRVACGTLAKSMPYLTAHLTALKEGLPILRTMKVKEDEEGEDDVTAAEVRSGRQSVLKAIKEAPAARVVSLQPAKSKDISSSKARTRSSSSNELDRAIAMERQHRIGYRRGPSGPVKKTLPRLLWLLSPTPRSRRKTSNFPASRLPRR